MKMIKLSSRIQLSPQYLTFSKSTINLNYTAMMATSLLNESRHLSFNLNFARTFLRLSQLRRYSTLSDKLKTGTIVGPGLKEFLVAGKNIPTAVSMDDSSIPYLESSQFNGNGRKVFFEIYGCQMNSNDGEVVYSVLKSSGYVKVDSIDEADVVLLVTCSIRDRAETKVNLYWMLLQRMLSLIQSNNVIYSKTRSGIAWNTLQL